MASQFALHTDVQWPNTSAVPHNFWQNGILTAPCCCAAQADNRLVTLQIHLRRFGLHTGVQWPDTSAVPHCFWQNAIAPCSVPMCNTGRQQACDTANTPMEICSSYRCAVADTRAVPHCFWQNAIAPCSVPMCNTGRQQACDTASPPKEIWSSYRFAVAQHQCSATRLLANSILTAQCCCAKQADSRLVTLQIHLRRFGLHTGVRWINTAFGKLQWSLLSAAVQHRQTAGL